MTGGASHLLGELTSPGLSASGSAAGMRIWSSGCAAHRIGSSPGSFVRGNDGRRRSREDQAAAELRNRSRRRPLKRGLTLQYLAAPSPDFLNDDAVVLFALAVARAGFQNVGVNGEERQLLPGFASLVEHEVGVL